MQEAAVMEWNVVLVIIALAGLFATVGAPIIKLNTNITTLNETIKGLEKRQDKLENGNSEAHERIWKHNDEQDEVIQKHEMRLHDIDGK